MRRAPARTSDRIPLFALASVMLLVLAGALTAARGSPAWSASEAVAEGGTGPGHIEHGGGSVTPRRQPPRTDCAAIAGTDLRSPEEGLWYERNCATLSAHQPASTVTTCNRTEMKPDEFREIGPGLFIYRGDRSDHAYLWYQSAPECFDLVSSRLVTAVCVDMTVTFRWGPDACARHGGTLAQVNGR